MHMHNPHICMAKPSASWIATISFEEKSLHLSLLAHHSLSVFCLQRRRYVGKMSVQRQEMEVSGAAPVMQSTSHPAQGAPVAMDPNRPFRNRSQKAKWDYGGNPVSP